MFKKILIKNKYTFRFYLKSIFYIILMIIIRNSSKLYLNRYQNVKLPFQSFKNAILFMCYFTYYWFEIGIILVLILIIIYTFSNIIRKILMKISQEKTNKGI